MKNLVENFPKQLQEALNIAQQAKISSPKQIDNRFLIHEKGKKIKNLNSQINKIPYIFIIPYEN